MSYLPDHFTASDWTRIQSFIELFPLATLISHFEDEIFTSHIPFIISGNKLLGHINKENPQFQHLNNSRVELVFHGGDAYISPAAFTTEELPTFNFAKVHVKGKVSYGDEQGLIKSLMEMTDQMDEDFKLAYTHPKIDRLKHFIQGFEVSIDSFHGRFKMSQDKSKAHFDKAKSLLKESQTQRLKYFLNHLQYYTG
ncbi:FMN-binding negative transcriptional regulator [Psychroflexus sediminis]|uniref:Negative transcriptional regulator, PaiB family n=1 Tax=Psychroflexus sediminis TaxID=470826 RepID=A0A1G7U3M5_9FLAO|nr:FMN-binding negative transcriptional regulator [Psychroflexus sediminis]SDG41649.1 negative transcriptional regulator, PaiB family [Psychroflexus sediminis]